MLIRLLLPSAFEPVTSLISLFRMSGFPEGISQPQSGLHMVPRYSYKLQNVTGPINPVKDTSPDDCECAYGNEPVDPNLSCVDVLVLIVLLQAYTVLEPPPPPNPLRVSYLATLFAGPGRAPEATVRPVMVAVRTAVPEALAPLSTVVYQLYRRGFELRAGLFMRGFSF